MGSSVVGVAHSCCHGSVLCCADTACRGSPPHNSLHGHVMWDELLHAGSMDLSSATRGLIDEVRFIWESGIIIIDMHTRLHA